MICICYESCGLIWNIRATMVDVGYEFTTGTIDWWCLIWIGHGIRCGKLQLQKGLISTSRCEEQPSNPVTSNPSNPIPHSHSNSETSSFYFEWSPAWQSFRHFWHPIWNFISPGWWFTYPSEKWWTNRQLGWFFHSQLNGKSYSSHAPNHQPATFWHPFWHLFWHVGRIRAGIAGQGPKAPRPRRRGGGRMHLC